METDVEGLIGAGSYERSGERTTWRNGYRDRTLDPARRLIAHPETAPRQLLPAVWRSAQELGEGR
jgi:hypothetical protein